LTAQAKHQHAAELHQLLLQSGIALAVMAVISLALGWLVARRVLRPVRTITTAVREISATNMHRRLALSGPEDELKELGDTFDALVGRLDVAFQAQRRFVANASHELRTPLARQRTLGQVALDDPDATVESLRRAHERILAAGTQQEQLIEAMLMLARGQTSIDRHEPVDLAEVVSQVVASRHAEATAREVTIHSVIGSAEALGDRRLLERLVVNLVDNALRHNVAGGHVDIVCETAAGYAVLHVSNSGPLIPADSVEGLFQPFRRLEADRTGDGLGLGLSIVQAVADAHDAEMMAIARPAGGLQFEVRFPRSARRMTADAASVAQIGENRENPARLAG
jgi:signal transduction histidine kinase